MLSLFRQKEDEGGGGGLLFGEFEEIKALFVLRGIGEWVQLVPAAVI